MPRRPETTEIAVTLFIRGDSPRGRRAAACVRKLATGEPGLSVTVVDVSCEPDAAERAHVVATPTLLRTRPEPLRRLIGDMSDIDLVRRLLVEDVQGSEEVTS